MRAPGRLPGGLRLTGVGRRYGPRGPWVLRDVTLELPPGSLVRVEGVNGSGKSTLLRLIAGIDRPTAGRVTGRPATATAYVPERFPAALPFPVLRYLSHLGAVRGLPAAAARARAAYWLERFGIAGHARTRLDELSKGTCQKVALAQALLADPELLVLDEAWTGLDTAARATLDAAVRARVASGATVVFVDHDPHRLADEQTLTVTLPPAAPGVTPHRTAHPTAPRLPEAVAGVPGGGGLPSVAVTSGGGARPHAPSPAEVVDGASGGGGLPAVGTTNAGARPGTPQPAEVAGGAPGEGGLPAAEGAVRAGAPPLAEVVIEASGGGELPADVEPYAVPRPQGAGVRLVVPASRSDDALRALLGPGAEGAAPGWHIASVRPRTPSAPAEGAPGGPPPPYGPPGAVRARRTLALLRYQADLLARSHRWLAPLLGYGAVMAIGVTTGEPILGSFGYAAALLLPVTAWLVRVCVGNEPGAARACTASAVGPGRAHAGALLTALLAAAVLGAAGTAAVAALGGAHTDDLRTAVPVGPAALAGLLAAGVSLLLGGAVGALTGRPLLRGAGWSLLATALGAGAALLVAGSPARQAVTALVTGSRTGTISYPLLPLAVAAVVAAAAGWASCAVAARSGRG